MLWLKQSTAVTFQLGPFVDKDDGVTPETGLATAMDNATTGIRVSKNGAASADRNSGTAPSHDDDGYYRVELSTTDTNTLGTLHVQYEELATALPAWKDFMVVPANVWDSFFGADNLEVDQVEIVGTTVPTPTTAGVPDVNVERWLDTLVTLSGALPDVNVEAMDAGSIAAGTIASGELTNIEDEIWDALKSAHVVANSFGDFLDIEVSSRSSHADPGSPPTVVAIADAVWDEDVEAAHGGDASAGLLLRVLGAVISNRSNNATLDALLGVGDTASNDLPNQILDGDTLAELTAGVPATNPTLSSFAMLLYMALNNELDTSSTLKEVKNAAGSVVAKATVSDTSGVFRKAKFVAGP